MIVAGAAWTVVQIMDVEGKAEGTGCDKGKILSFVNIGLGVMHITVCIYVQNAIVNRIIKMKEEAGEDPEELKADDIMKAAKHIIAYDFVFCFYFFALPAGTFYTCYGISTLSGCGTGKAFAVSIAMIGYGFATMFYLPCMYCGTCCAAHTKKVPKKGKKGKKDAAPIEP